MDAQEQREASLVRTGEATSKTVKILRPTTGPKWAHSQPWSKSRGNIIVARGSHGQHEPMILNPLAVERQRLQGIAMERLAQ